MKSKVTKLQPSADIHAPLHTEGTVPNEVSAARTFMRELRISIVATLVLAAVVSGIYPLIVWALGQGLFPNQADGSLVRLGGIVVGSELIAQNFESPKYFHPRPSAAGDAGYDAAASSGSNLGPLSKKLLDMVKDRAEAYRADNGLAPDALVPADAVTASGSGLEGRTGKRNSHRGDEPASPRAHGRA